jgi:hypothetical protein
MANVDDCESTIRELVEKERMTLSQVAEYLHAP